jgi:hypothetical protein
VSELRTVLGRARELLLRDGNDYSGTTFEDVFDASDYWTYFDETLGMGMESAFDEVVSLFKPGGVLERVGERSGWAAELAPLAQRVWPALEQAREEWTRLPTLYAMFLCALCDHRRAGDIALMENADPPRIRIEALAGNTWSDRPATREEVARLRPVLDDPAALHAIDPSLAPAYCPDCPASYCGEHWTGGRCPLGHTKVS